jgi:hypothetical protein
MDCFSIVGMFTKCLLVTDLYNYKNIIIVPTYAKKKKKKKKKKHSWGLVLGLAYLTPDCYSTLHCMLLMQPSQW